MAGLFANGTLLDGYALTGTTFATDWVDIASFSKFSVSATFTGNSPTGTLSLEQSNDLQWTGSYKGPTPRHVGNTQYPNDATAVPAGTGQATVSVSGAGAYAMNQYQVGYRWFRVVYVAIGGAVTTTVDMLFTAKEA